ncbi:MAG: acyl-CoA dehydrogenase family protein [Saprospiraceae bacterium]
MRRHRHLQQRQITAKSADAPGVSIVRPLEAFGLLDSPGGHAEVKLTDVRVPASHLILGEGRGFEIAQGRLGPGRIHHCMRVIGAAQRSLDLMKQRVQERQAFGRKLAEMGGIRRDIALSHCELEQARLLTLAAADKIDREGVKAAKEWVAMIKIVCPTTAQCVIDRAIQAFGGMGVGPDVPLSEFWVYARTIRIADGPDEVHIEQLGKNLLRGH